MRPFFSYYGGKWAAAPRLYPAPAYSTIVEPFAGSAGYATRYPDRDVVLCDLNPVIAGIWRFLIAASPAEILALPDVPEGGTVDDVHACEEARWLIGFWLNRAAASPRKSPSKWARNYPEKAFWGPKIRARLASQVIAIRHWRIFECSYEDCSNPGGATWFVDPPYRAAGVNYPKGSALIDYGRLGDWCQGLRGEVIVCEAAGETWLPFREVSGITGMRRTNRPEAVWYRGPILGEAC